MILASVIVPLTASLSGASTTAGVDPSLLRARDSAWPAPSEVRCETRNLPREVSRRNYVIDRVTECRPIAKTGNRASADAHRETDHRMTLAADPIASDRGGCGGVDCK